MAAFHFALIFHLISHRPSFFASAAMLLSRRS